MKKTIIILFIAVSQLLQAQVKELNTYQIEVTRYGDQVTYKLIHNYDARDPDKPNEILDGTYKIGNGTGEYAIMSFKSGKLDGESKYYNREGLLVSVENYKEGKQEDVLVEYYKNGNIHKKSHYKNGEKHGKCVIFNPKGEQTGTLHYKNGKQDGKQEGAKNIVGRKGCTYVSYYDNGEPTGLWETKCRGKLMYSKEYTAKRDYVEKDFYKNEQLERVRRFKDRKLDGERKDFDIDGVLLKHYIYKDGILLSKKEYFNNGVLKLEQHKNLDDERHGSFATYYDNGNKAIEETYKNGYREGLLKYFYKNGNLKKFYTYKTGKRTGESIEYYKDNTKKMEGTYFKNKKTGIWKKYDANAKLVAEYTYENGKMTSEKRIRD